MTVREILLEALDDAGVMTLDELVARLEGSATGGPEADNLLTADWRTPAEGGANRLETTADGFRYTLMRGNGNQQVYQRNLTVLPGQQYALEFKHRSSQGGSARVFLHDHTEQGRKLGINGERVVLGNQGGYLMPFAAPVGSEDARLRFMFDVPAGAVVDVFDCRLVAT